MLTCSCAGDYSASQPSSASLESLESLSSSASSTFSDSSTSPTVEAFPQVSEDKSINGAAVAGGIVGAGKPQMFIFEQG